MKKVILFFLILLSFNLMAIDFSITDYYDSTYGDYIPESAQSIDYSNGCFYVVSDLGTVVSGDTITLTITYPDGSENNYTIECGVNEDAIFYKEIDLKGLGDYTVNFSFKGESVSKTFEVVPDSSKDSFEPNNFTDNQFFLDRGSIFSKLISVNDVDYYTLKLDRRTAVDLSTESDIDLSLKVYQEGSLIAESDEQFSGNESLSLNLDRGIYTVMVYSPIKETGDYILNIDGDFPVYLPLSNFERGFSKNVAVSNLSPSAGSITIDWYDNDGNLVLEQNEDFNAYETKEFDATNYSYLKAYSDTLRFNACAFGANSENSEAIAYEGQTLVSTNSVLSHIAPQTYLYETLCDFSFNQSGTNLKLKDNMLLNNFTEDSSFLINFNDYFDNNITDSWGILFSDSDFASVEMFRLITGDNFQATALSLSPKLARVFYLPHIDVRYFWWTGISIVNPNNLEAHIVLTPFDSNGNALDLAEFTIEPMGKSVDIVTNYFDNGLPENAASMKIESDVPISALYLFGTKRGDSITEDIFGGLNSSAFYSKILYFSILPSSDSEWSGVGIFNPNNDNVEVDLKGYSIDNQLIEEKTITLSPNQKYVSLGADIFNDVNVYRIVAISEKPITGFYLFGDKDHTYLYGMEALK